MRYGVVPLIPSPLGFGSLFDSNLCGFHFKQIYYLKSFRIALLNSSAQI
jgi:hypothetical protein